MLVAKNNEEKRSRIWRNVIIIASVLLVIVIGYFLYQGFFGNPLAGTWKHDESDLTLEIREKDTAVLTWDNLYEDQTLVLNLQFSLDKSQKVVTFRASQEALEEAAEALEGDVAAEDVESVVDQMVTSFDYSVDGTELTLTEREYGEQMLFYRTGRN
ncbi:MAG TPA: hypothetical protein H9782_07435 [Candidatus Bariatricus faecipullorum]|nr:hypothetical protein [Candidatus Bariatricus faecipullorum]